MTFVHQQLRAYFNTPFNNPLTTVPLLVKDEDTDAMMQITKDLGKGAVVIDLGSLFDDLRNSTRAQFFKPIEDAVAKMPEGGLIILDRPELVGWALQAALIDLAMSGRVEVDGHVYDLGKSRICFESKDRRGMCEPALDRMQVFRLS